MKNSYLLRSILYSIASIFVLSADVISNSGSILLWGETKCPKNLLK